MVIYVNYNCELLQAIYKTSEMQICTINKVIIKVEHNNHIKIVLENELKEYDKYRKISKKKIRENKKDVKESGSLIIFSNKLNTTLELLKDDSYQFVAQFLIKKIRSELRTLRIKKRECQEQINEETEKIFDDFINYQKKEIKTLKEYLE